MDVASASISRIFYGCLARAATMDLLGGNIYRPGFFVLFFFNVIPTTEFFLVSREGLEASDCVAGVERCFC